MNLVERDKKFIWHPFTPQKNMEDPIAITHGKDSYLFDDNGNAYIDAISSWWVTLHGHANEYIAKAIYRQALKIEQVIFAGFTHAPAVDLAEKLLPVLPGPFTRIFYSDNGSTSTEVALKMAIQFWWNTSGASNNKNRNKILTFKDSYHGDTFGAMSVSERSVFTLAFHDKLFEVLTIDTPNKDNVESLKNTISAEGENIAAFIYEPLVQGAGGMKMYNAELMDELLETLKAHKIICIADEVMTGFGRTGKLFSSEFLNNKPDIICLSKGLTGGTMALGVTACTDKIYQAYVDDDKLKTFFHGHSFTANPLACTAALASLDLLLKESTIRKWKTLCNSIAEFAKYLEHKKFLTHIIHVRTLGTILAFEIDNAQHNYLNNAGQVFTKLSMQNGVYLRPLGNTVYLMPPYCVTKAELEKIFETIIQILNTGS